MKKNKLNLLRVINVVLLITMVATILVSGTYAKFTSRASGTSAVVVANWSFMVGEQDITVLGSEDEIEFDLFTTATIKDSDGSDEEDVAEGLIAPGTSGKFEFVLSNTSDVVTEYKIQLSAENENNIPIEFSYTGEEGSWTKDLNNLIETNILNINGTKNVVVQWRWPFDGEADTALGTATETPTITVTASITATQTNSITSSTQYVEKQLFTDIENVTTTTAISNMTAVTLSAGPYVYQDVNVFSGKTITKIGIPVKSVSDLNTPQTFTLYVVDKEALANKSDLKPATIAQTHMLTLPKEQLGDTTTVNKMVYVNVNITLAENQTLAFCSENDTVIWGFLRYNSSAVIGNQYKFIAGSLTSPATNNGNIIFDIYVREEVEVIDPDDETESPLKTALKGKNLSILGDSISTYDGYSNNSSTTNTTIGSNKVYYTSSLGSPITDVNMTWWMQAANETGMNVLVNNSYSGDTIANRGKTRAMQLHDDTGDNSGTNPDIVAVYIGINDVKNTSNLSTTVFGDNYTTMVTNIKTTYPDADIFVFTLPPYTAPNATVPSMGADEIEVYNQVIRNVANENGCTIVDIFNDSGITEDNYLSDYMWDTGLHPNEAGMDAITETFISALSSKYLN
ncbi:MAG: SGNH/GDSL hydrolase family protein [Clostridia bacterium]|nr:SGNH/GDSL hydrolase family protein [Clostridia bacterium]